MDDMEPVGAAEASALLGVELQRISRWRKQGKLPAPYAPLAASPVWLKKDIEAFTRGEGNFTEPPDPVPWMSTAEVAAMLDVDKSQIGRWRKKPSKRGPPFPTVWREIKAGPLWKREQIEQYAASRQELGLHKRSRNGAGE